MRFLIDFGKIHAVGVLQAGDLARVILDFQICGQNGDVNRFPLRRTQALSARPVQFHIAVMGEYEFVYDGIHGRRYFRLAAANADRSECLRKILLCISEVTLPSNACLAMAGHRSARCRALSGQTFHRRRVLS